MKKLLLIATFTTVVASLANAQAPLINGAGVRSNFGVDADMYANKLQFGYYAPWTMDSTAAGTDDWFYKASVGAGAGIGVLDTVDRRRNINATIFKNSMTGSAKNKNRTFYVRMNPGFPPFSVVHGADGRPPQVMLDAVGFRDNFVASNAIDSSVFSGQSNKNGDNPKTWSLSSGGTPPKNDFVDVGAHLRVDAISQDLWGFGFATTMSADGNSHLDYEIYRDINYGPGYINHIGSGFTFAGADSGHTAGRFDINGLLSAPGHPGDVLVAVDYENGGTKPTVSVRIWIDPSRLKLDNNGNPVLFDTAQYNNDPSIAEADRLFRFTGVFDGGENSGPFGWAEIKAKGVLSEPAVFARVNTIPVYNNGTTNTLGAPWGSLEGGATPHDSILTLQLSEVGVNFSAFGLDEVGSGGQCTNLFGNLMLKTRSSSSFTSELKDYAGPFEFGVRGEVHACKADDKRIDCTTPNGSVTIGCASSTPGAQYSWSTGATTATITVSDAGTYYQRVFLGGFTTCEDFDTIVVTKDVTPPGAVTATGGVITCTNTSVQLSGSSSTTGVTYSWTGPDGFTSTNQNPTVSTGGVYTLIVTNPANGCTGSDTANVNVNNTAPGVDISPDGGQLTCSTTSILLTASSSTSGVTFSWTGGPTGSTKTVTAPGQYCVTATNPVNGCTSSDCVTVTQDITQPPAVVVGGNISCTANSVQLTVNGCDAAAGVTYSWTGPNGFSSTDQCPTVTDSGTYNVVVTKTANSCTNSGSTHVAIVIPTNTGTCGGLTSAFEIADGNANSDAVLPGEDWDVVRGGTSSASVYFASGDAPSSNDNAFTIGSKDQGDIPSWHWTYTSTPDKDDILDGGAAQYGSKLYFFADRYATNGNAQIGFWFFKNNVQPLGTNGNGFSGTHAIGDLLVLTNFIGGGGTPNIFAYEWVGSGGSDGTLNKVTLSGSNSFATVNSTASTSPWSFQSKSGAANSLVPGTFFEGGIDLACLPGIDPCFTAFLLETRSSQSVTASLKDFLAGQFVPSSSRMAQGPVASSTSMKASAFPNPFNSTSTIQMTAVKSFSNATVELYSINGEKVQTLFQGSLSANQTYQWQVDGSILSPGIYTYRIMADDETVNGRIVLLNK